MSTERDRADDNRLLLEHADVWAHDLRHEGYGDVAEGIEALVARVQELEREVARLKTEIRRWREGSTGAVCAWGHRRKAIGCVSCEQLWRVT